MNIEIVVNEVSDGQFEKIKDRMKSEYDIRIKGELIAMEGCVTDDKIILGGKNEFMSHFCTFFNFSSC